MVPEHSVGKQGMTDSEETRRDFSYGETSDTYVSTDAAGSGSVLRTRGAASSSSRVRPYPARNDRASSGGLYGQDGGPAGRGTRTRTGRRSGVDDDGPIVSDAMDVDAPRMPSRDLGIFNEERQKHVDIRLLLRAWQNERHAPDILPVCSELLSLTLDLIRSKVDMTNTLRNADVTLSDEEHYCVTLVQTEIERIKFVIRSYVRTRLSKIEQHAAYITLNPETHSRLTEAELRHVKRYGKLIVSQFNATVLDHLPDAQRDLDDKAAPAVPSMTPEPDKSKPVFFHALEAIDGLQMDNGDLVSIPKDTIMLVPYRVIEQHVLRGEVELV